MQRETQKFFLPWRGFVCAMLCRLKTVVVLLQNKGRKTFVSGQISEVTPYLANVVLSCVREASSVTGCSLTS